VSSIDSGHNAAVSPLHSLRLRPRLALGALAGVLVAVPLALLVLAVRTGWAPVRQLDRGVADGLHGWAAQHPLVVAFFKAIAVMFDPWTFRIAVLVLVVVLLRRGARRLAWWAAVTMTVGSVLGFVLKLAVARARPSFATPEAGAPGFSFPSGHALNSAVGTLVLLLVLSPVLPGVRARILARLIGALVVLVTGFDRVALGVHYLSDVVAGWLVAVALVAGTVAAFESWRRDVGLRPHDPLKGVEPEESEALR
jgi:membrane-associated phospholipid phosphatase